MLFNNNLGFGFNSYGSRALASIIYQDTLSNFVYTTDGSGNVILDNQGSLDATNDGLLYSGRGIELGATNGVDIPIHHTLGVDRYSNIEPASANLTITPIVDGKNVTWTVDGTSVSNSIRLVSTDSSFSTSNMLKFTATINSGTLIFDRYYNGTSYVPLGYEYTVINGLNEIELPSTTGTKFYLTPKSVTTPLSVDFTLITIQQITNPNSHLTYYDFTDGLVTLGNSVDGGSSDNLEKVTNGTFDSNTTGWTIFSGAIQSSLNSTLEIVRTTSSLFGTRQTISTVIGRRYRLSFDLKRGTCTGDVKVDIGGIANSQYSNTEWETHTFDFTARETSHSVQAYVVSSTLAGETAYFDNISVKEILPISTRYTLNTKTVNNVLTHATPWSASGWAKINNNPNLIGKLALETTGATKTIPELDMVMDAGDSADSYYMCSEKSGAYLVDSRVGYGAEIHDDPSFDTPANWIVSNATVVGGQASLTVTAGAMSYVYNTGSNLVGGKYYIVEFDVSSFTGIGTFAMCSGPGNNVAGAIAFSAAGITSQIFKATTDIHHLGIKRVAVSGDYSCVVDSCSIREATATEIANYAETVRTNADLQNKGIQTTAFVTDGAGVPTAYSSKFLQFNGDGRYITGSNALESVGTQDFYVEMVLDYTSGVAWDWMFFHNGDNGNDVVIAVQSDRPRASVGTWFTDMAYSQQMTSGLHHLIYMRKNGVGYIYLDKTVSTINYPIPSNIGSGTLYIGKYSDTDLLKSPLGLPKIVVGKSLTQAEVDDLNTKAKTIYPTLP